MIVGLKNASLVVVTTLVLIFSMATAFLPWEDIKKEEKLAEDTTMRRKKKRKVGGRT